MIDLNKAGIGSKWKTRDGRMVVYLGVDGDGYYVSAVMCGRDFDFEYYNMPSGIYSTCGKSDKDLVSEWKEPRYAWVNAWDDGCLTVRPSLDTAKEEAVKLTNFKCVARHKVEIIEGQFDDT